MQGPINYAGMLAQLDLSPLAEAGQLRQVNRERQQLADARTATVQLAQDKFDADQQSDADFRDASASFAQNPTEEAYRGLLLRFPDKLDALKAAHEAYTPEQQSRNVRAAIDVGSLINAGAIPAAIDRLQTRRDALAKGGESTEITDDLIEDLKSGDPNRIRAAKGKVMYFLSAAKGKDAEPILQSIGFDDGSVTEREKFDETVRHNKAGEANAAGHLAVSQAAGARADRKAASGGSGGGKPAKLPTGFILD